MRLKFSFFVLFLFGSVHCHAIEQSINFYAHGGRLINAVSLPYQGEGFIKIFRLTPRQYGSTDLVQMVKELALDLNTKYPAKDRLEIGDMANMKGGFASHHVSHQNGLDVDIAYLRNNGKEQDPNTTGSFAESFVIHGKVTANFDAVRNWFAIRKLAAFGNINRIFVDPAIKAYLCKLYYNPKDADIIHTLGLLRPLSNHNDHMHVRLNCPKDSPHCIPQGPVPPGAGCSPQAIEEDMQSHVYLEDGC